MDLANDRTEAAVRLGIYAQGAGQVDKGARIEEVRLLLASRGLTPPPSAKSGNIAQSLLESYIEQSRRLHEQRCGIDERIETFLRDHFADLSLPAPLRLPANSLVLGRHGLAREMSLPSDTDKHCSELLSSYRLRNGVLNNPANDRRTTEGTFHVAEGGLAIPGNKKAVPKAVFAALFNAAMNPPADLMTLPFTAHEKSAAKCFVSLLLRPLVCPEVQGVCLEKTMEVRFFAPGSLVSNLDFVESIFGNAGDPYLPRNDAALDAEHWSGHTGCVILAPHLTKLKKKDLGLPNIEKATDRQRHDGMCWTKPDETYNDGTAFKLTCRTRAGVIVTIIADNYYGYCKKEVKTQISYAANLMGNAEEEHSGGALAFASYSLGHEFVPDSRVTNGRPFADIARDHSLRMDVHADGYGVDKTWPDLIYIPEDARGSINRQEIWWSREGVEKSIPLMPDKVYMTPSGYNVRMEKHPGAPSWRLIGTSGNGTFCHKPCTVSGGGKSEISKSIRDYMLYGPIFVADATRDMELVDQILAKSYQGRWLQALPGRPSYEERPSRPILSPERSLGSVVKLLTPSTEYTPEFNAWLNSIPSHVYAIVFIIKRFSKPEWEGNWRPHFTVDVVNGASGHELKLDGRPLVGTYLRVGLMPDGAWRTFKLRQDFAAAMKLQMEDDISASVTLPAAPFGPLPGVSAKSVKFARNCEYRLFQRPDDAIIRGLDKQTEYDMSQTDNFISNFEPLTPADARAMESKLVEFERFTQPMQELIKCVAEQDQGYFVCSANPRLVNGKPSKNPRYLQIRPDMLNPMSVYVAEQSMRLARGTPESQPVHTPVHAVLVGRRNNPAEPAAGIRALAVYNPIHYQELPELFMDFICSLTGKSPSTTGAGSEGALTKSPFNALRPIVDTNNALVSYILTGLAGFSSSAGHVGPRMRVGHDISLLVPEVWCRMYPEERDPNYLIAQRYLEPLKDFSHGGKVIPASRLGYRITERFVKAFFGRLFDNPAVVFDEAILRPETQDLEQFADGVLNISDAQRRVALGYFEDGSIDDACPPLRALLHIMAHGNYEGRDAHDPSIRSLFTLENLLSSSWYRDRLIARQKRDISLWKRHVASIENFMKHQEYRQEIEAMKLSNRLNIAKAELKHVSQREYVDTLVGTIGTDPSMIEPE